jgi:ATP-dependent RNA helicase DDX35
VYFQQHLFIIDFQIQRRRPELRLIISSATIEAKTMSNFFNSSKKRHAPEGSTPGPKLEPAILSVEVYCDSLA